MSFLVCGYGCCWSNKYLCHFVTHAHRSVSRTTLLGTPAELLQQISDKAEADLGLQTGPTHQGGGKAEIGDSGWRRRGEATGQAGKMQDGREKMGRDEGRVTDAKITFQHFRENQLQSPQHLHLMNHSISVRRSGAETSARSSQHRGSSELCFTTTSHAVCRSFGPPTLLRPSPAINNADR